MNKRVVLLTVVLVSFSALFAVIWWAQGLSVASSVATVVGLPVAVAAILVPWASAAPQQAPPGARQWPHATRSRPLPWRQALFAVVMAATLPVAVLLGVRVGHLFPGSVATSPTPPAQQSPVAAVLPHVYDLPEADGRRQVTAAGYAVRVIDVCSGSVAAGRVRQLLIDVSATQEGDVVDDRQGVTQAGHALTAGARLLMKVSNGHPCP